MHKGIIDLGTPRQLAEHVLGPGEFDVGREGYHPIPAARDYLVRYPLTPDMLGEIDTVILDGGNAIYAYIWLFWSGEDDSFDVSSLEGLSNCPNIRALEVVAMISVVDIAALVPLRHLSELYIGVEITNIGALLDMPGLQSVRILNDRIYDEVMTPSHPTRTLMEKLKERGIHVWVHWMTYTDIEPPAFE